MSAITVVDQEGKWVTNPHLYSFFDPETKIRYEPGDFYKVNVPEKSWLASQVEAQVLKLTSDPTKAPPKVAAPPATKANSG